MGERPWNLLLIGAYEGAPVRGMPEDPSVETIWQAPNIIQNCSPDLAGKPCPGSVRAAAGSGPMCPSRAWTGRLDHMAEERSEVEGKLRWGVLGPGGIARRFAGD